MLECYGRNGAQIVANDNYDETRGVAHLPNLDIEILHRRPWHGEEEILSITLRAAPSFDAFFRFWEAANPLVFWARALESAWTPWLGLKDVAPSRPQLDRGARPAPPRLHES